MSRQIVLLCVCAVLSWSFVSANNLVPPTGYSVGFTGTISQGSQNYICNRGCWTKTGSSAVVLTPTGTKLGTYWSIYDKKTRSLTYYWNIVNSAGGSYEGGHAVSGLQASSLKTIQVSSSAIYEYLALVKKHRGMGDADQVAFVSLTGTKGGLPPSKALCTSDGAISGVPFSGKFTFYTQDREPPAVPAPLVPKGIFVMAHFLDGKMIYKFKGGKWCYQGLFATMSEVAGGNEVGKFGTVNNADRYGSKLLWQFKGPNAFWLKGKQLGNSIPMSREGCPWQLLTITTSGGTESPLGKYTSALIAATYGGKPPAIAGRTEGMTWSSCFYGRCYLYAQ